MRSARQRSVFHHCNLSPQHVSSVRFSQEVLLCRIHLRIRKYKPVTCLITDRSCVSKSHLRGNSFSTKWTAQYRLIGECDCSYKSHASYKKAICPFLKQLSCWCNHTEQHRCAARDLELWTRPYNYLVIYWCRHFCLQRAFSECSQFIVFIIFQSTLWLWFLITSI